MNLKYILSLITVEPVIFFYTFIIFMESNAFQSLFFTKICTSHYKNETECKHSTAVLDETTAWNKYYSSCLTLSTLLTGFYAASWTDYFGRKAIMLVAPIGTFIASIVNITLSMYFNVPIAYFLISAVISGLTFGLVGIIASTFGYISDIVPLEHRTQRIIILESMIFTGGTVGIFTCGAILKYKHLDVFFNNYARLFTLEACITIFIVCYIVFRISPVERTISDENVETRRTGLSGIFDLNHVKEAVYTVFKQRSGDNRKHILLLILALIFIYYGSAVQFTLSYLFVKEKLSWNITTYTNFHAVQFAVEGITLLLGLPLLFYYFHISDHIVAMMGIMSRVAGLILFGLSTSGAMVYACAAVFMFSEFPVPTVRSLLSKLVDENERGKIFAFTTIIQNLCYFSSSLILPSVFQASLTFFPGLCFEIIAGLQLFAFVIFCYFFAIRNEILTSYEIMTNEQGVVSESRTVTSVSRELHCPANDSYDVKT